MYEKWRTFLKKLANRDSGPKVIQRISETVTKVSTEEYYVFIIKR